MPLIEKRTDQTYFAARADKHMPQVLIPPCHACGAPSVGGTFLEFDSAGPTMVGVVRFSCPTHESGTSMLTSKHLFPGWKIVSVIATGVYKVRRLTEAQQEEECRDDGK